MARPCRYSTPRLKKLSPAIPLFKRGAKQYASFLKIKLALHFQLVTLVHIATAITPQAKHT